MCELKEIARAYGIEKYYKMKKEELIENIISYDASTPISIPVSIPLDKLTILNTFDQIFNLPGIKFPISANPSRSKRRRRRIRQKISSFRSLQNLYLHRWKWRSSWDLSDHVGEKSKKTWSK